MSKYSLKRPQMNEIFQYFADVLLVTMQDALILLLDKFLKIKLGCSLALAISVMCKEFHVRANETAKFYF